jgi:hypothetical protein
MTSPFVDTPNVDNDMRRAGSFSLLTGQMERYSKPLNKDAKGG